ncbi:lanthionine synthetase LanC family protein, partial [Streptomyces ipomoeae]|uniref:lanthionine synthetase LanC family protein n=1 Tax=Streptomyces ipomoeae TaxID=103232 RepID=UPI0029B2FFD7
DAETLEPVRFHLRGRPAVPAERGRAARTGGAVTARPAEPRVDLLGGGHRAQQLAAIALDDEDRKRMAERALLYCLDDPDQLDKLSNRGLCHGVGGVLRTVQRFAQDAEHPYVFTDRLPLLRRRFLVAGTPEETGFLEGEAGAVLAFQSAESGAGPVTDWDACLLLI